MNSVLTLAFLYLNKKQGGTIMGEIRKENIPYFLTKEYGDKQRGIKRNVAKAVVALCIGIVVVKLIMT